MFFPLRILRRHVVWTISAKRSYTISDKFSLVDHPNTCLEAVRAGIDASKSARQSQKFGEFISAMLFVTLVVASCWNFLVGCRLIAGSGSAFYIASLRMPDFCENLQHEHPSEACWVHYCIHFVPIHIHACLKGQFVTSSSVTIASCWAVLGILSRNVAIPLGSFWTGDCLHCSQRNNSLIRTFNVEFTTHCPNQNS